MCTSPPQYFSSMKNDDDSHDDNFSFDDEKFK